LTATFFFSLETEWCVFFSSLIIFD
jgi:hypothetical protein